MYNYNFSISSYKVVVYWLARCAVNVNVRGSILRMGISSRSVENFLECSEWMVIYKNFLNIHGKYICKDYA